MKPKNRIFTKGYGLLSFAENIGKYIAEYISKKLMGKYSQTLFDSAK